MKTVIHFMPVMMIMTMMMTDVIIINFLLNCFKNINDYMIAFLMGSMVCVCL